VELFESLDVEPLQWGVAKHENHELLELNDALVGQIGEL